jgi:hypothetical protein
MFIVCVLIARETAAHRPVPLDACIPQIHKDLRRVQRKERKAPRSLEESQSRKGKGHNCGMAEEEQTVVVGLFQTIPQNEERRSF